MNHTNEDCFKKADETIDYIQKQLGLKLLTPINFREENVKLKQAFLAKKEYHPQYEYPDRSEIAFSKIVQMLDELSFPSNAIGDLYTRLVEATYKEIKMYQSIGQSEIFTGNSELVYGSLDIKYINEARKYIVLEEKEDKKLYSAEQLAEYIKRSLHYYSFGYEVILSKTMPSKAMVSNDKVYINANQRYSDNDMKRLCVHEISTHVLRKENGKKREYSIFTEGTSDSMITEEGLALYNEDIAGTINISMLKLYAARFLSCINMKTMSLYDMVNKIEPYIGLDNAIYVSSRIKVGLEDTSKPGGFMKDFVYFQGYQEMKSAIQKTPSLYNQLYYGVISMADVTLLKDEIEHQQLEQNIIMPKWDELL